MPHLSVCSPGKLSGSSLHFVVLCTCLPNKAASSDGCLMSSPISGCAVAQPQRVARTLLCTKLHQSDEGWENPLEATHPIFSAPPDPARASAETAPPTGWCGTGGRPFRGLGDPLLMKLHQKDIKQRFRWDEGLEGGSRADGTQGLDQKHRGPHNPGSVRWKQMMDPPLHPQSIHCF